MDRTAGWRVLVLWALYLSHGLREHDVLKKNVANGIGGCVPGLRGARPAVGEDETRRLPVVRGSSGHARIYRYATCESIGQAHFVSRSRRKGSEGAKIKPQNRRQAADKGQKLVQDERFVLVSRTTSGALPAHVRESLGVHQATRQFQVTGATATESRSSAQALSLTRATRQRGQGGGEEKGLDGRQLGRISAALSRSRSRSQSQEGEPVLLAGGCQAACATAAADQQTCALSPVPLRPGISRSRQPRALCLFLLSLVFRLLHTACCSCRLPSTLPFFRAACLQPAVPAPAPSLHSRRELTLMLD